MNVSGKWLLVVLSLAVVLFIESCIYVPAGYPGPPYGPPVPGYYRRVPYDPNRPRPQDGDRDTRSQPAPDNAAPYPDGLPNPETKPATSEPGPLNEPPQPAANGAPTATKVPNRPGRVKSPFPPYRELDVAGLPSGSLAKDPVAGKIFKVP